MKKFQLWRGVFALVLFYSTSFSTPVLIGDGFTNTAVGSFGPSGAIKEYAVLSSDGNVELSDVSFEITTDGTLISHYQFEALENSANASLGVFMDADINADVNTYWNDTAEVLTGTGGASSWEIDEPGYRFGDIYDNFMAGTFDNTSIFDYLVTPEDVSLGLGFNLGTLSTGDLILFNVALAENSLSTAEWGTVLHQWDVDNGTGGANLFMAGRFSIEHNGPTPVPEPSMPGLIAVGIAFSALTAARRKK